MRKIKQLHRMGSGSLPKSRNSRDRISQSVSGYSTKYAAALVTATASSLFKYALSTPVGFRAIGAEQKQASKDACCDDLQEGPDRGPLRIVCGAPDQVVTSSPVTGSTISVA